jgi:tetratricopeptide (TPR) repeat protein
VKGAASPTRPPDGLGGRAARAAARVRRSARAFLVGLAASTLSTPTAAEAPLPDWREETLVAAWIAFDEAIDAACTWPHGEDGPPGPCDARKLAQVIADAQAFLAQVADDPRIRYLVGLAQRHAGRADEAIVTLRAVVAVAPDRAEAWSDLGELLLARGDAAGAADASRQVIRLHEHGDLAWLGWFQLAQAEGTRGDVAAFDAALQEALRQGMPPGLLVGQPIWRRFWRDARLQPSLDRLLRLHEADAVIEALRAP